MIDPAYPALSTALVHSLLWRTGAAAVAALAMAWPSSAAARTLTALRDARSTTVIASIAALAWALWMLLQQAVPLYVRPGLPVMWPLAAIAIIVIVAMNGRALERAWPHSRLARLFARPQDR
jgi:hypothetical protein